ncbi:unnamed protein product, partial [Gongylonema pulchrum]|uniref:Neur_chan_LBD domain-containing protein n=1 Tax=Gongylonema pulchrum TaxID=637853 RepID=A0A183F1B6_9BILA
MIITEYQDGVIRRQTAKWSISYVSAQLLNTQIHLFGDSTQPVSEKFFTRTDDDSFFIGLDRLSYIREARFQDDKNDLRAGVSKLSENDEAVHRLTIYDLRASWTPENRDTCL